MPPSSDIGRFTSCTYSDKCQYSTCLPSRIGVVLDFLGVKRAAEDVALAVGEPLLEDLAAAELVAPDGGGDAVAAAPPEARMRRRSPK